MQIFVSFQLFSVTFSIAMQISVQQSQKYNNIAGLSKIIPNNAVNILYIYGFLSTFDILAHLSRLNSNGGAVPSCKRLKRTDADPMYVFNFYLESILLQLSYSCITGQLQTVTELATVILQLTVVCSYRQTVTVIVQLHNSLVTYSNSYSYILTLQFSYIQ